MAQKSFAIATFAACLALVGSAVAAMGTEDVIEPETFARRIIVTTDLVLDRHLDPPTRQAMILAVAKSLAHGTNQPVPAGLSKRVSELAKPEDFASLLQGLWGEALSSGKAPAEQLQNEAIEGLCSVVPGHTHIIPTREIAVAQRLAANRYVGIGVKLSLDETDKLPVISVPFVRGPAHRAGIRPNDRILEVDGTSTVNATLDQTVQMLRGEEGTTVTVVVRQPDEQETRRVEIIRGVVPLESVLGYRRTSDNSWDFRPIASEPIGYIWIPRFVASTLHELRQAARILEAQEIRALVLDLREVPGGELQHFLRIADELIGDAVLGRSRDARGTATDYHSGPDSLFPRWPIMLLVNHTTASAAEFLAAALQDNKRAIIVGEATPGQCHIHQQFELPDDMGAIVLRTGTLERADGRAMHSAESIDIGRNGAMRARTSAAGKGSPASSRPGAGGVQPDHVVEINEEQWGAWLKWRHEQDLPDPSPVAAPAPDDPQLDKAMELLRAMLGNEATARS